MDGITRTLTEDQLLVMYGVVGERPHTVRTAEEDAANTKRGIIENVRNIGTLTTVLVIAANPELWPLALVGAFFHRAAKKAGY